MSNIMIVVDKIPKIELMKKGIPYPGTCILKTWKTVDLYVS